MKVFTSFKFKNLNGLDVPLTLNEQHNSATKK